MLTFEQTNVLGQILSDTSSKGRGSIATINSHTQDDILVLVYNTIVNFACETSLQLQTQRLTEESIALLKERVSEIKKRFSEVTGDSLSLKEKSNNDSIELIQATSISPRKVAYYRRFVTLKIEN